MTPLRQHMLDAMQMRGFSVRTHKSYLYAVSDLARYYRRSPEQLNLQEIQAFFMYLVKERKLSAASCRLYLNGIRFLYLQVLKYSSFDVPIPLPKQPQRIPELLTRQEVAQIIAACRNLKHRTLLLCAYGCGLRVSELVSLQVRHIDGERQLLRIEQGKGAKDRNVILSNGLLLRLRRYWCVYHPGRWLFPSSHRPEHHLGVSSAQKVFQAAKGKTGIAKTGGIHSLRHAYATHQLEAGLPVHQLQRLLGHRDIHSTLRYIHWVPNYRDGASKAGDLVGTLEVDDG